MPLDDDQLRALGRISVHSAELDFYTHMLVCLLVNRDLNIGRLAFEGESFAPMLRRAKKLSEEVSRKNPELGSQIQEWATRAGDLQQRRNEVLHAIWVLDQPAGKMIALRLTKERIPQARTRADQLDQLADEIERVVREASEIFYEIWPFRKQPP